MYTNIMRKPKIIISTNYNGKWTRQRDANAAMLKNLHTINFQHPLITRKLNLYRLIYKTTKKPHKTETQHIDRERITLLTIASEIYAAHKYRRPSKGPETTDRKLYNLRLMIHTIVIRWAININNK